MHQDNGEGMSPALDIAHLSHAYGVHKALDDVSFSIPAGRFTVLLGLNGAGKTTLFSLISHLFDTRAGSIRVFGRDINRFPGEALSRLGIVFQARTLDLDLSVAQNLAYHAALHGIGRREAKARIGGLLKDVGLAERLHDKARTLSGGQMRRVEIVRALLHRPSLLLLDEATVGLDVRARADILATIRGLVAESGLSVLWATHLIDEVEEGDDVVILDRGRVLAAGGVADVVRTAGAADIAGAFAGLVFERVTRSEPDLMAVAVADVTEEARAQPISPCAAEVAGRAEGDNRGSNAAVDAAVLPPVTSPPQERRSSGDRAAAQAPCVALSIGEAKDKIVPVPNILGERIGPGAGRSEDHRQASSSPDALAAGGST